MQGKREMSHLSGSKEDTIHDGSLLESLRIQALVVSVLLAAAVEHSDVSWGSRSMSLCAGEIVKPTHELRCAAVPGGRDFHVPLYSLLQVACALGVQENKTFQAYQSTGKDSVLGQKLHAMTWKTRQEERGTTTRLVDADGIAFLVEALLPDRKDYRSKMGFIRPDPPPLAAAASAAGSDALFSHICGSQNAPLAFCWLWLCRSVCRSWWDAVQKVLAHSLYTQNFLLHHTLSPDCIL